MKNNRQVTRWHFLDINDESYVIFEVTEISYGVTKSSIMARRVAQLPVQDESQGYKMACYICKEISPTSLVQLIHSKTWEELLNCGKLERLQEKGGEVAIDSNPDSPFRNLYATRSKLIAPIKKWEELIPVGIEEFEQIEKESNSVMFIGPQPNGLVRARNRLHHFFN